MLDVSRLSGLVVALPVFAASLVFGVLSGISLNGLRLPTAAQTASRLTSTMAWDLRPLSMLPI